MATRGRGAGDVSHSPCRRGFGCGGGGRRHGGVRPSACRGGAGAIQWILVYRPLPPSQDHCVDGAGQRRRQPVRHRGRSGTARATCSAGSVLISNFNNKKNLQGTGTDHRPDHARAASSSVFAKINADTLPGPCPGGVGLTTALAVLRGGWVVVGSLPDHGRDGRDRQGRLPDRAEQHGSRRRDDRRPRHQRPVGHDLGRATGNLAPCSSPTCSTARSRPTGKVVHRGTVLRLHLAVSGSQAARGC